ncbi:uncharacterized protein [Nicotiana tomentosiformis]|uniref:uncharacterized protein n=1 Tax=Nicotiana tomentosiformis TaxID=4098 RepID=UPI00388C4F24
MALGCPTDDTIIFSSADPYSLRKIVEVLSKYEHTSGQMINKTKSSFYMHSNGSSTVSSSIGTITGFLRGEFPFSYLGCPIFYTRRRKDYYNNLIKKCKGKAALLETEATILWGKATLISSVLQSMPTHILSVIDPPKNVLEHLHKTFVKFFWSNKEEGRSRHWTKWQNPCLPKEEEGGGQEVLFDTTEDSWDVPRWMPIPSGNVSISSAWNILRHRAHANPDYNKI